MLKYNSKAILQIDAYAITLRNRQIYFYSFIIVSPHIHLSDKKEPDAFNSYSIPAAFNDDCNDEDQGTKKKFFKNLFAADSYTKEHKYPSPSNEQHKCLTKFYMLNKGVNNVNSNAIFQIEGWNFKRDTQKSFLLY